MSSSAAGQSAQNMQPGLGRTAAMLGLSAHLGGREGELQKMLIDERIKSESFRAKYQSLKEETTRLQDEFIQAQNEIKHLLGDRQTLQDKMNLQMLEFQKNLLAKTKEVEELRQQMMGPLQQELLKAQMQQEMEAPVREMCHQLEEEMEKYKTEYYKLRYECIRLQSQLDHQRDEHARTLESQRVRCEAEVSCLQKDKQELVARLQNSDLRSNDKKLEALLKERVQLKVRLQGLETEVAELHAQKENLSQQAENAQTIQSRQLSESQTTLRCLEAEHESTRLRLQKMEEELQVSNAENSHLSKRLHGAERQVTSLTGQIENLKFSHKQEVNNMKLEFTLSQGELEKERNKLQGQIEGLQTEVEVLKAEITQHKAALVEKEREVCRKVQSVRDEEFRKTVHLQEEKLELESRLSSMQQQTSLKDAAARDQMAEWEERLSSAKHREESASQELQDLRAELQQQSSRIQELDRYEAEIGGLQQANNKMGEQLRKASSSEDELRAANKQLREALERVREQLESTQVRAERIQQEADRLSQDKQREWMEERERLQQKYSEAKDKMQRAAAAQKKRKTMTETKERKLQNKIQLQEAKIETLELEVSAAKKTLSLCEQAHKRKIKDLLRRHSDFQRVLFEGGYSEAPRILTSSIKPVFSRLEEVLPDIPAEQHQERSELWRRMDDLERTQQQLKELSGVPAEQNLSPQSDL